MQVNVQVTQEGGFDHIHYNGPINEDAEVHLTGLLNQVGPNCVFNFRDVTMVNSCGVRAWINFMREFEKGRKIEFSECTPEVVLQINMIPSFKGQAKINSVYGQYSCGKCNHKQRMLFVEGRNLPRDGNYPEV